MKLRVVVSLCSVVASACLPPQQTEALMRKGACQARGVGWRFLSLDEDPSATTSYRSYRCVHVDSVIGDTLHDSPR